LISLGLGVYGLFTDWVQSVNLIPGAAFTKRRRGVDFAQDFACGARASANPFDKLPRQAGAAGSRRQTGSRSFDFAQDFACRLPLGQGLAHAANTARDPSASLRISPVGSRSAKASLTPPIRLKLSKNSADDQAPARPGAWRAFPGDRESEPSQTNL
jgi:hypothetical protein